MMIHILLAFLAASFSIVYSVPHCPGGQLAPKATVTTTTTKTTTTSITTTVHHTLTVTHKITHHIPTSFFSSFSTQVSKHNKPNQPTASESPFSIVTITAPASTPSQINFPPQKGASPVSRSSPSDSPGPTSTPTVTSDCDVSADSSHDGHPSGTNEINGSGTTPHIQNRSDISSTGSSPSNGSYSNSTVYNNDNSTLLSGNNSRHGPMENSLEGANNDGAHTSNAENSNDSGIQNGTGHSIIEPSDDKPRSPMKLCCNSQGQPDSLAITLMAHSLGLDLSNKTGIIGVGCTVIGEGSLRDASECPHSLIDCGFFSPLEGVGSHCSI